MTEKLMSLCLIFTLLISCNAYSTIVKYLNFKQLVEQSDHVLIGEVQEIESKKHGKTDNIYTTIKLENAATINNNSLSFLKETITIRHAGGSIDIIKNGEKVGEEGVYAHGTPEFSKHDKVILFIRENGTASMPILGWKQGVFRISNENKITDYNSLPIVGLDGAHLLLKTNTGLKNRKQLMIDNCSDHTQFSYLNPKKPKLSYSEAKESSLASINPAHTIVKHIVDSNSFAMDKRDFISIIQEIQNARVKLDGEALTSRAAKASFDSLFKLPAIHSGNKIDSILKNNKHEISSNYFKTSQQTVRDNNNNNNKVAKPIKRQSYENRRHLK